MSQEPWRPCNGEDSWLSKGHTMGVGKANLCSHGPSSIVSSENGPCCGTIAYFVGKKEGMIWFDKICLKLNQLKRITWWCLSVLEAIMEYACNLSWNMSSWKKRIKAHGLPKFALGPPLGGGLDENSGRHGNLIHSPACRTPYRLFIHEVFFGPLGRPSCVEWTWTVSALSTSLWATSHTRPRAYDHYNSSTLIGGKDGAGPSSLHTSLKDQQSMWMQDECEVYMDSYMASNG